MISLLGAKAPITVTSIASLANAGYYNKSLCHRLTTEGIFVLQCGDPTASGSGSPTGWKGYANENLPKAGGINYPAGTVAMANSGPNTNGSQFFITHVATPWLDGNYNIFGNVIMGQEVVTAIGNTPRGQADKPKTPVYMTKVQIIRIGDKAKKFDANDTFKSMQ